MELFPLPKFQIGEKIQLKHKGTGQIIDCFWSGIFSKDNIDGTWKYSVKVSRGKDRGCFVVVEQDLLD